MTPRSGPARRAKSAEPQSRWTRALGRTVNALEEGAIALLLAAMTVVVFAQLVARHLLDSRADWAPELAVYLLLWLVLFGMSYGVKVNAHLGVDAFVRLCGAGPRRILGLLAVGAALIYGAILLLGSWQYVGGLHQSGIAAQDLPIPQWVALAILPIGAALLLFRLAQLGSRIWNRRRQGMLLGDEAADAMRAQLDGFSRPPAGAGRRPPGTRGP